MNKIALRATILALLAGGVWLAWGVFESLPLHRTEIPSIAARQGDVTIRAFARGELRAARSVTLRAPELSAMVRVDRLAPLGSFAHAKDLIAEFDESEAKLHLEEKELEVEQIGEQLNKAQADLAISQSQDELDALTARYGVRRAELQVKRNPFLPPADAQKNLQALEDARRRLKQIESDIQSRREQAKAQLAALEQNKARAQLELARDKRRLAETRLLAPISGLVAIRPNQPNFFFSGMQLPDIHEGDQLSAGQPVAEILDLSNLQIVAQVGALDRANLVEGQQARVVLDAIPDKPLHATVTALSGPPPPVAGPGDAAGKFDVTLSLDMQQLFRVLGVKPEDVEQIEEIGKQNDARLAAASRASGSSDADFARAKLPPAPAADSQFSVLLRPGLLADVRIDIERIPRAIYIPTQAVFEHNGKFIVWVKRGGAWRARPITVLKRGAAVTAVARGLAAGERIALSNPGAAAGGS